MLQSFEKRTQNLPSAPPVTALARAYDDSMRTLTQKKGDVQWAEGRTLIPDVIEPMEKSLNRTILELQDLAPRPEEPEFVSWEGRLHEFLDDTVATLVSLRSLRSHHQHVLNALLQHEQGEHARQPRVASSSLIRKHTLADIVEAAISHCTAVAKQKYGVCPPIKLEELEEGIDCLCAAGHVQYIVIELLKNSIRAIVDKFGVLDVDDAPPIVVTVSGNAAEVGLSIRDEGGGISNPHRQLLFCYFNTSAVKVLDQSGYTYSRDFGDQLAGYGLGLGMSKQYARCMGGDLQVTSLVNSSTTASLNFCRHGLSKVMAS